MGRYYRATRSVPVDYMFNMNIPLMEKVIKANDEGIDAVLAQAEADKQAVMFDYTPQDEEHAKSIMGEYNKKIDFITNALRGNYANWREQSGAIRALTNQLSTDYRTGDISKLMQRAGQRKKAFEQADEAAKLYRESKPGEERGLPGDWVERFKRKWDAEDKGGYDKKTGTWRPYVGGAVPRYHNISKELEEGMNKVLADEGYTSYTGPYGNTMYMLQTKDGYKRVSPNKLISVMQGNITPEMVDYLQQLSSIGVIPEESLKAVPYDMVPDGVTKEEQQLLMVKQKKLDSMKNDSKNYSKDDIAAAEKDLEDTKEQYRTNKTLMWNPKSYLGGIMKGLLDRYTGGNIETHEQNFSANEVALTQYRVAHDDENKRLDRAQRAQEHNDNMLIEKAKLDQKERELELAQLNANNYLGGGKGSKTGQPMKQMPAQTQLTTTLSNDYGGMVDENGVPRLSKRGLSNAIITAKTGYNDAMARVKQYKTELIGEKNPYKRVVIEEALNVARADARKFEQDYNEANNNLKGAGQLVLTGQSDLVKRAGINFTKEDATFFTNMSDNNEQGYKNLDKMLADVNNSAIPRMKALTKQAGWSSLSPSEQNSRQEKLRHEMEGERQAIRNMKQRYETLRGKYNDGIDIIFDHANKTQTKSEGAALNPLDSYAVANTIMADNYGNVLIDPLTMRPYGTNDKIGVSAYRLSFEGDNNILDYINSVGGAMYVDKVKKYGVTNSGKPVAEITFNDPGGLLTGKKFLVNLNESASNMVGMRLLNSKDKGVYQMGNDILNGVRTSVLSQMEKGMYNLTAGGVSGSPGQVMTSFKIKAPVNGQEVPIHITATPNFDPNNADRVPYIYSATIMTENGPRKLQKLTTKNGKIVEVNTDEARKGIFYSADEVAETVDLGNQLIQLMKR